MRLIFIRHGDPDYSIDSLTEAGFRPLAGVEEEVSKKREEAAKELEGVRSEKLRQVAKEADEMLDAARERARSPFYNIIR